MTLHRWAGAAVLAVLVASAPAWAVYPPPVKDDAKFFKVSTIEAANKKIREIYENYRKDVVVETFSTLTSEQEKALKADGKDKFFRKLSVERVKALGVNGFYVVISKNPTYLQVELDSSTRKAGVTNADRDKIASRIIAKFKDEDFDGGLQAGFEAIDSLLKKPKK